MSRTGTWPSVEGQSGFGHAFEGVVFVMAARVRANRPSRGFLRAPRRVRCACNRA